MERPKIPNYDEQKVFDSDYVFNLNRYIEILERKIKVLELKKEEPDKTLCLCIDKCSEKKQQLYCTSKRNCKHQI